MTELRTRCTGPRSVHLFHGLSFAVALGLAAVPVTALSPAEAAAKPAKVLRSNQGIEDFYRARSDAPLWLSPRGGNSSAALTALLRTAWIDGLSAENYRPDELEARVAAARASGRPKDILAADRALSEAFVSFVRDLRRKPVSGVQYVDQALRPNPPSARGLLLTAASAPSLSEFVTRMDWMNPIYVSLRKALVDHGYADEGERARIAINLDRARALPGGGERYILVNAAEQRLRTYEGRKEIDSMRVVVGKAKYPTPMMAAYVRFAALNPYWYVPPDLAGERIAPNVLRRGMPYLQELGYEVLTAWDDNAEVVDPTTVDWKGVVDGTTEVLIRQKPGPHNSMGRMKFMFPNSAGVYLHDNPERELFSEASRLYSGGCVRLEDAARLGQWLFGRELDWKDAEVEERVMLPQPVPVYITYLTALPKDGAIAFFDDVYDRDGTRVAGKSDLSADSVASR